MKGRVDRSVRKGAVALLSAMLLGGAGEAFAAPPPMEVESVKAARTLPAALEVVGVVSRKDSAKGTFALIDRAEFARCQQVGCAPFALPVKWGGKLPAVTAVVRVKGSVRETKEGKFLFAESVEPVAK